MSSGSQTFIRRIVKDKPLDKELLYHVQDTKRKHVVVTSNNPSGSDLDDSSETGSLFKYSRVTLNLDYMVGGYFLSDRVKEGDITKHTGDHKLLPPNKALEIGDIYLECAMKISDTTETDDTGASKTTLSRSILSYQVFVVSKLYKRSVNQGDFEVVYEYIAELTPLGEYLKDRLTAVEVKFNHNKTTRYLADNGTSLEAIISYRNKILQQSAEADRIVYEAPNDTIFQFGEFIGPEYTPDHGEKLEGVINVELDEAEGKVTMDFDSNEDAFPTDPVEYNKVATENAKKKEQLIEMIKNNNLLINFVKEEEAPAKPAPVVPESNPVAEAIVPPIVEREEVASPAPAAPVAPEVSPAAPAAAAASEDPAVEESEPKEEETESEVVVEEASPDTEEQKED